MSAAAIATPSHQDPLNRDTKSATAIYADLRDQYPPDVENTLDAASGAARTPRPQVSNLPIRKDSLPNLKQAPNGPRRSKTTGNVLQSISPYSPSANELDNIEQAPDTNIQKKPKLRAVTRRNTTGPDVIPTGDDFDIDTSNRKRHSFKRLSRRRRDDDEDRVIIGIRIAEGHQNYVLMYNMLTGIRIAVSIHYCYCIQLNNITPEFLLNFALDIGWKSQCQAMSYSYK